MNPIVGEQPYNEKIYGVLKGAYGDKFTHTPESFLEKISTDKEYQTKIYSVLKQAYGDKFTHTPESFVQKIAVKKKEQSGFLGNMQKGLESALQQPSAPSQKNFEQRFSQPEKSIKNEDGTVSTHKMMSANVDGKEIALPTIVEIDGKLKELSISEAIDHAMKTGEYKEFKTQQEAQAYAEGGYKKGTKLDPKNKVTEGDLSQFKEDYGVQEAPKPISAEEAQAVFSQATEQEVTQADLANVEAPKRKTNEDFDYEEAKEITDFYRGKPQRTDRAVDEVGEAFTGVIPAEGPRLAESLRDYERPKGLTREEAEPYRKEFFAQRDRAILEAEKDYANFLSHKGDEYSVNKWVALKEKGKENWSVANQRFMRQFQTEALNAVTKVEMAKIYEIKQVADVDAYEVGAAALNAEINKLNEEFKALGIKGETPEEAVIRQKAAKLAKRSEEVNQQYEALGIKEGQAVDEITAQRANALVAESEKIHEEYNALGIKEEHPKDVATRKKAEALVQKSKELNAKFEALKEQTGFTDELQAEYEKAANGIATTRVDLNPDFADVYASDQADAKEIQANREKAMSNEFWSNVGVFFEQIPNSVTKNVVGLSNLPKTLWDVTGDTSYDWTDELYDGTQELLRDIETQTSAGDNRGLPSAYKYSKLIGDAVGSIVTFATGGSGAVTKIGRYVATATTAFLVTQDDYYKEALEAGMTPQEASAVGMTLAAITGSLEGLIPDSKYFASSRFRKSIINAVMSGKPVSIALKEALQAVPASALSVSKSGAKEGVLDEGLQTLAEDLTKTVINSLMDTEMETFNPETYKESIIAGFAAGGGMSVLSRPKPKSPVTEQILMDAVRNPEQTIAYVPAEQQEQVKTQLYEAAQTLSVLEKHPNWSKLTPFQQNHVLSELQRKGQLEETAKVTGKDEAIMSEIGAIDAEVQQIMSGKPVEQEKIEGVPDTPSPVVELEPTVTSETVAEETTPTISETETVATEEVIEVKAPEIIVEETVEPTPKKKKVTAATRTNTRVVDDKIVENTEPASTQTEAVEAVGNEVAEVEEIKTETEEVAPVPADLASEEVVAPKADSVVGGGVEVGAKPKPIDEQSIVASQKWVKDLYSLPDLTRIQDKSGNVYDVKDSKIRKLTLDKEGNVIDAEIIHTDRDVHKRGAYSNPDFFNEGYRILPEQSLNETSQSVGTPSEVKPEQPKSLPQSWREKAARIKGGSGNTLMIAPKVYAFALELAADVYEAAVKAGKSIDEAIKASRDAIRKYLASDDEFKNLSDEDKTDTLNAISDDLGEAIDTDFERKEGKKSLLNRAATGTESERIKNAVIAFGLDYEIETQAAAEKAAKGFIDKVGLDEAVEAVRRGYVNGAMAAFVWAKAIDMVSDQISEAKNDAEIAALEDIQRSLLDEFDRQTRDNARFISALGRIYENSNFGYNLSSMVRRYKAANGGVIDAETEARFKEYERQIKELNDKIKEAEKRVQEAEERAAAQAIVDSVENDKRNPNRYAQKAKKAANKFREFKKKPFELKDANGNPIQINTMGIAWNDLIEIGAKAIELSGRIADGISAITAYLGNEDWYKNLSVEDKKAVDAQINEYFYETNEDGSIPNSVIRDIVASGVTELDALIEKLGAIFPSLTERQIRDQISGYGKEVSMSRDEITADVNRLKRAARIISKIEDLRKGVKPSTSTRKRAEADQKEKQLLKDLRAAMQDFDWSAERLDQAKTNAKKAIDEYERRIRDNDFSTKKKQKVKPDTELRDLQTKRQEVKSKYDTELHRAEIKNRSLRQRVIDGLLEIWNLTRAIMATAEMSFVNVQGGLYSLTQPMKLARAFKKAVEHFWSEKKAEQWGAFVKSQPYFQEMQDSKLALSEYDAKLTAREEQFMGGWINQLFDWFGYAEKTKFGRAWMKLNFPKRLERAGVAYLNTMRILRWLDGKQMLEMKGKPFDESTVDDYKMMADVVNTLSGRASLGKLENQTKGLAFIFFSPRLWASVIKTASPYALYHFGKMTTKDGKPSIAQQMVLTDLLKFYTLTGAIVAMAAAHYNDDDDEETGVELDPRSSDFMKIKTGPSTRIDPWGGRQQEIVFWFRLYFGEIKNTNTGEVNKLGETPFITNNLLTLALRRIETKLSPSAGIVSKFMQSTVNKEGEREDRFGKPYSFTDEVDNLYPMYWGTLHEIWKENPKLVASFLSTYAFFGGGVQVYGDKGQGKLDQFGQPFTGKDHIKNSLFYQLYENADIPNDFSNIDKILGKDQPKISPEMQREIKDKMFYYWRDEITSNAEDLREMPLEDRVKEMDDLRTNVRTAIREYVRNVYEEGKPIDWSKLESN